jgi:hypothetical protein
MAWLQLLSIARTRVVDRLCDSQSLATETTNDLLSSVDTMISVLDAESVRNVVLERAGQGRCGNPACGNDVREGQGGLDEDTPQEEHSDKRALRKRVEGLGGMADDGEGGSSSSEAATEDDEADGDAHESGDESFADHAAPGGHNKRRAKALSWGDSRLRFCSVKCRETMRHARRRALTLSDNDSQLVDRVLRLFPGLNTAFLAMGGNSSTDMKPTVSLTENASRKPELVQAAQLQTASALERQVQLRLPTSGQTYVGGTWMSVAARALSLAFYRVSPATVAAYRTNAVKHAFEPFPPTAGLFQELQARLPLARWRTVEAVSTTKSAQQPQQKTNDPADQAAPDGVENQGAIVKRRAVDRLHTMERRRQFASLLMTELRRASLLLRVNLVDDAAVTRVITGVAGTLDVQDLVTAPPAPVVTVGRTHRDPDPETCLLFLLALLGAATVTDPRVRELLSAAEPAMTEVVEAMHLQPHQFVRLMGQFFDV